ncbi:MAG TPA: STAS domain-containing protein [Anaerolineales bacterium]|nr:STAS domain-containing protein [Anaerolineales bacterium]
MEIKVSTENARVPVTVMHVDGNIDASTYQTFQTKADEVIDGGARHILVDLSHAPYVSSAGFRALHQIFNKLRSLQADSGPAEDEVKKGIRAGTYKSPHLKLLNLSRETKTTFEMSGFDMFIETYDDRKSALASF